MTKAPHRYRPYVQVYESIQSELQDRISKNSLEQLQSFLFWTSFVEGIRSPSGLFAPTPEPKLQLHTCVTMTEKCPILVIKPSERPKSRSWRVSDHPK
jgi:hypothetical protein